MGGLHGAHSPLLARFLSQSGVSLSVLHPLSLLHHSFCKPIRALGVHRALQGWLGITASPWEASLYQGILSRVMSALMGHVQGLGWWKQGCMWGPRQRLLLSSKPEMMGVGGEDTDKQRGLKGPRMRDRLKGQSRPAGYGVKEKQGSSSSLEFWVGERKNRC